MSTAPLPHQIPEEAPADVPQEVAQAGVEVTRLRGSEDGTSAPTIEAEGAGPSAVKLTKAPLQPIHSVGLVVNYERQGAIAFAKEYATWLQGRGLRVCATWNVTDLSSEADERFDALVHDSDLVVVLGGDGSILGASRRAGPAGKPILGIHWGGMGFLNECVPEQAKDAMIRILEGQYYIEERLMLVAELWREGEISCRCTALNDVAVTRDALSRILRLEVTVGDDTAATYQGDGVLVSTPTGSTGYSLSAGGPVMDPRVEALAVTPICPHSFNGRSIVVPATERLRIRHLSSLANVIVTLDGQVGMPMRSTDTLDVSRAPWSAQFVRFERPQFYRNLRDKLNWKI